MARLCDLGIKQSNCNFIYKTYYNLQVLIVKKDNLAIIASESFLVYIPINAECIGEA